MKQFICKVGASNYYLVNKGMGGHGDPPGHAQHKYSISEFRGGHNTGCMSLSYAATCEWTPEKVKATARLTLAAHPGNSKSEQWIKETYKYFKNCYVPDGGANGWTYLPINEDCPVPPPEWNAGYLFVKRYDPDHTPRLDLIEGVDK